MRQAMVIAFAAAMAAFLAPAALAQSATANTPTATDTPDTVKYYTPDQLAALVPAGKHGAMMAKHESYISQYADRTDTGNSVEVHDHWSHFVDIISGEGTLTYGGTVIGGKLVSPGETLGETIQGGTTISLHPGDYVQIPAGTPHLFTALPGAHLRYFLMNIHR